MSEAEWYYAKAGAQQGPVSLEQLRQMLAGGQVLASDMVWTAGMASWQPAVATEVLAGTRPPPPLTAQQLGYAGPPAPGQYQDIGESAGMRMLLPVGRSGWAIAAGYLGLFSFIIFPAPFALIVSIVAVVHLRRDPKLHGWGRAIFGLVMGILGTVLLLVMLVAMVSHH